MADRIRSYLIVFVIIVIAISCCIPLVLSLRANLWGERDKFFEAIEVVETEKGDTPHELGLYQITRIFVDDVNRILGYDKYEYIDRLDRKKSQDMILVYLEHYATPERLGRPVTVEDEVRIIKGGPNGYKYGTSLEHWEKVKEELIK